MDHQSTDSQNPYASPGIPTESQTSSATSPNKPNEPLVQPIRISGSLTLNDYYYGIRLGRRRQLWLIVVLLVIGLLMFLVAAFLPDIMNGNLGVVTVVSAFTVFSSLMLVIILRWLINRRVSIIHAAAKGVFAYTESVMYEDHYEVRQEVMTATVNWSIFCKFRPSARLVVFILRWQSLPIRHHPPQQIPIAARLGLFCRPARPKIAALLKKIFQY
jgi:hypothetical protein